MKKITLLLFGLLIFQNLSAQQDPEALLESVYNKIRSFENIKLDFDYSLYNEVADIRQDTKGSITLKDSLYFFDYMGIKQLFDGTKVITIVDENEEVTIVDKTDDQDSISPSNLFDFYRDGYNYEMDIEQNTPEGIVQYIKLTPIDSDSDMEQLLLGILKEQLQIYKLIQKGNNGTVTTISVKSFITNTELDPNRFVFDRDHYQQLGYYIIED